MLSQVMGNKMNYDEIAVCAECGSEYRRTASKMKALCPECTAVLYGYENCPHILKDGKCIKCLWDGSKSDYIRSLSAPEHTGTAPQNQNADDAHKT